MPFLLLIIAFQFAIFHSPAGAQAVTQARNCLRNYESGCLPLSKKSILLSAEFMRENQTEHLEGHFKVLRHSLEKHITHMKAAPVSGNFQALKTEYSRYLQDLHGFTIHSTALLENCQEDSLLVRRKSLMKAWQTLFSAAIRLEQEVAVFCIENRLNRPEDGSRIGKLMKEGQQKLDYLLRIQELTFPLIQFEKLCLSRFTADSLKGAEKRRLEFAALVAENNLALKALPPCCGDHQVKTAALNSLRLFSIESRNELVHLEKFIESEADFISHHQRSKENAPVKEEQKEAYRIAVRKYNADIKAANDLLRQLDKNRQAHLAEYSKAQIAFIESWITAFPE